MRKAIVGLAFALVAAGMVALPAAQAPYYPPAGQWAHKTPAEVGMDAAKLDAAIEFMKAHEARSPARDFSDQEIVNGKLLASIPTERAATNALIIRHGYIVAEFGDTMRPDPTYSVAKSMLSTVTGVAVRDGLIPNLDAPVGNLIKDGGYDSPHNQAVTWRNHLQQESEWEGEMWTKNANFIGAEAFGRGEMKPRAIQEPGTHYEYNDVRINRFALSLLRLFKKQIPDVFRDEVMNPIGASTTWKWVPYANAYADIDGKRMASVSGGTRWGGGMWISTVRHGALRSPVGARRQMGRPSDRAARLREDGDDGERARSGLRLLVVAQYHRQTVAGFADDVIRGAGPGRQRDPRRYGARSGRRVAMERDGSAGLPPDR